MWLPTAIYERIPYFWMLLGILFMVSGIYLGLGFALAFVYFGFGFFCLAWGACIVAMRSKHRKGRHVPTSSHKTAR